jgi:hypothetical protein
MAKRRWRHSVECFDAIVQGSVTIRRAPMAVPGRLVPELQEGI